MSWWRGRICSAFGQMLLRQAKWICKSCLFQTLGNLLGPIARLVSPEGLKKPKKDIRSTSRSDERKSSESHRESRPYSPVCAPHQDKGKGPVISRANKDASRQSTSRAGTSHSNREESHSTASRRSCHSPVRAPSAENMVRKWPITEEKMLVEPTAKKVRQSSRYQDCPVPRCGAVTNYMKDHVQSAHMPSLFVQLEPEDRALGNTHRQRLNG